MDLFETQYLQLLIGCLTALHTPRYPSNMKIAGIAYDIYDDSTGAILRSKLAAAKQELPEKLANMRMLGTEELEHLPDRLYGLVAVNEGETVRKYAMHDAPHLALSMIYFGETGRLLPTEAAQKVAQNMITACGWYDLEPPVQLTKLSLLGGVAAAATAGLGLMDMASKAKEGKQLGNERMEAFRQAQASGIKQAGREVELTPQQEAASRNGNGPEAGYITSILNQFSDRHKAQHKLEKQMERRDQLQVVKEAEIGRDVMPVSALSSGTPMVGSRKTKLSSLMLANMNASWQHAGDISDGPPTKKIAASFTHYALPHLNKYPIDTEAHVKTAAAYFDDHFSSFPLPERRAFCSAVMHRAEELGIKVAGRVNNYAGDTYGANLIPELTARINQLADSGSKVAYEVLLEKISEVEPAVMAEMLREADIDTGLSSSYGRPGVGHMDPYEAVYGMKLAEPEEPFSWSEGTDYTNEERLKKLVTKGHNLDDLFTKGFAESFAKDPVGVFKSMPDPQKVVLSRLASS